MSTELDKQIKGCVAVYINKDGRVIASVSDFDSSQYGGYTLYESQRHRVQASLSKAVINAYCSSVVSDKLDAYMCEQILAKLDGHSHFIQIGAEE